jgi:glycosyltransferase involved in cell wall biosynthesis
MNILVDDATVYRRTPRSLALGLSPKITVLIPTLNETGNLSYVLSRIPPIVDEILIVDGYSSDNTVAVAKQLCPRARVIYQDKRGKGDAIKCGIRQATGDIIVTLDCDGSMDPQEIPRLVTPLLNGYDSVKGSRFLKDGGTTDMPTYRRLGNKFFVFLTNLLYGTKYTDITYGYQAFWKKTFEKTPLRSNGFETEIEMHIEAIKTRLRVMEVPSFEHKRLTGEGKLKSIRDGWRILSMILRKRIIRDL